MVNVGKYTIDPMGNYLPPMFLLRRLLSYDSSCAHHQLRSAFRRAVERVFTWWDFLEGPKGIEHTKLGEFLGDP